jgi:lipid II:glycine glycyltransferase (peptidoglycan interpeptide bridge formation enzyme)
MYEVISNNDRIKWEMRLNEISKKDVFYHHSYSTLYQKMGDGNPFLFFYEDEKGNKLCYSFLKREINQLAFMNDENDESELFDIITPSYGYGGPLYDYEDEQFVRQFRSVFSNYCKENNIITEFIRFHPILQNQIYMDTSMEVAYNRETIFVDLMKTEKEIFNHYHKNHKRNVKKAIKNNLEFRVFQKERTHEKIDEFYKLYKETMDKLNASDYSYFSTEYLTDLLSADDNHLMMGAVLLNGNMVAAAICMHDGGTLHYHLGCSKQETLNLGTTIFLLHKIALWGNEKGLHTFHLGGGHVGRDSLFQFKHRFHAEGSLNFYIGKKVHHPEIYYKLLKKWEQYYLQPSVEEFFPSYRYPIKKKIISAR